MNYMYEQIHPPRSACAGLETQEPESLEWRLGRARRALPATQPEAEQLRRGGGRRRDTLNRGPEGGALGALVGACRDRALELALRVARAAVAEKQRGGEAITNGARDSRGASTVGKLTACRAQCCGE